MLLLAVALNASQASLSFASSITCLFQDSLPGAAVHLLNDTQVPCFGNLGELLILKVDYAIAIEVEHQCLGFTDAKRLPSAEFLCGVDLVLQ